MDKNKIIQSAQRYVQKGQIDKAIRQYAKVLKADPKDVRTRQRVGDLQAKKGAKDEAIETYLEVADAYSKQGFFLKAVAVLKQILKLKPDSIDVNLKLADLYHQLGLMSETLAQFQAVVAHYEEAGDTEATLDTLRKMLDLDSDNVACRVKLAETYLKNGKQAEAVEEFQKAASWLKERNRIEDYARVLERLLHHTPDDLKLTRELADIYLSLGDTKRSLAKLQVCFRADPRDIDTLYLLGQAFLELGQKRKTVSVYKELARIHGEEGRSDEEKAAWKRVLQLVPGDAEAKEALEGPSAPAKPKEDPAAKAPPEPPPPPPPEPTAAPEPETAPDDVTVIAQVDMEPAEQAPKAKQLSPADVTKLLTETDVYVKYGLHDKALRHLETILTSDPSNVEAHEKAKLIHLVANKTEAACQELVTLIQLTIDDDLEKARGYLTELAEIDPEHLGLDDLKERVGRREGEDTIEVADVEEEASPPTVVVSDDMVGEAEADLEADAEVLEDDAELLADAEELEAEAEVLEDEDELIVADEDEEIVEDEPVVVADDAAGDEVVVASDEDEEIVEDERVVVADDAAGDEVVVGPDEDEEIVEDDAVVVADDAAGDEVVVASDEDEEIVEDDAVVVADDAAGDEVVVTADEAEDVAEIEPVAAADEEPVAEPVEQEVDEETLAEAEDDIEEAEFFLQQGLQDEAREALQSALEAVPGHPRATELLAGLDSAAEADDDAGVEEAAAEPGDEAVETMASADAGEEAAEEDDDDDGGLGFDSFDLAGELAEELAGLEEETESAPVDDFQVSADDVFAEFKKGVAETVEAGDAQTHYDLGIAYREMGLIADAVEAFKLAAAQPDKRVDALTMMGLCQRQLGQLEAAVESYRDCLRVEGLKPDAAKAIHYEIASVYADLGDDARAVHHFKKTVKIDPAFRDAKALIEEIGPVEEVVDDEPETPTGSNGVPSGEPAAEEGGSKKRRSRADKVGYV